MAASAFSLYNRAKFYLGGTNFNLGTSILKMSLHTSASNAATLTLSTIAAVTGEISARGGYATGGRSLLSMTWGTGASAKQYKFDAADLVFTASGSALNNVKFAVIHDGTRVLAYSKLSTAQFTVASPNTLTIQFNSAGIFTLV